MSKKSILIKNESVLNEGSNLADVAYRGLCSTCKCSRACTYPKDPYIPVIQCEEFEGIIEKSEKNTDANPKSISKIDSKVNQESKQYQGLCRICEKRETCTFPKSHGGVWHCEEYE